MSRTLRLAIILSGIAALHGKSDTTMKRIPIDYYGVRVSIEMPEKWAEAQFGYRSVPPDVRAHMGRSGAFVVCAKTLEWSRGIFRKPLGHVYVDVSLITPSLFAGTRVEAEEVTLERDRFLEFADFAKAKELRAYLERFWLRGVPGGNHRFQYAELRGVTWIRVTRRDDIWNGVPISENWFIGVDRETYVRLDFAAAKDSEGPKAEAWQKSALYWQNKMIESLTVTGLEQDLTGVEDVETWRFPETLEYAPDLIK